MRTCKCPRLPFSSPTGDMVPKNRTTPFNRAHEAEYGLKVATREPTTGRITSVECRFYTSFGREEKVRQKRRKSSTTKYFTAPFRVDLYKQHHTREHPTRYFEYSKLSAEGKSNYFKDTPHTNTINAHFVGAKDQLISLSTPRLSTSCCVISCCILGTRRRRPIVYSATLFRSLLLTVILSASTRFTFETRKYSIWLFNSWRSGVHLEWQPVMWRPPSQVCR